MAVMANPTTNASAVTRRLEITTTMLYMYVNGDGSLKQAGHAVFA